MFVIKVGYGFKYIVVAYIGELWFDFDLWWCGHWGTHSISSIGIFFSKLLGVNVCSSSDASSDGLSTQTLLTKFLSMFLGEQMLQMSNTMQR